MTTETLAPQAPATNLKPGLLVGFVTTYAIILVLGILFFFAADSMSAFRPAIGLYLAALLIVRREAWPILLLAGFFTQIAVEMLLYSHSPGTAGGFAAASTLEALTGAYLIQRFALQPGGMDPVEQLLRMIGAAAITPPLIGATIGTLASTFAAPLADFGSIWVAWWTADALGILLVAPPLLALAWRGQPRPIFKASPRTLEAVVLTALVAALIQFALTAERHSPQLAMDLPYLILPFLTWASFRLNPRQITTILLLISMLLFWHACLGRSPFMSLALSDAEQILSLQGFIAVAVLSTLLLSTTVQVAIRRRQTLRKREREFSEAQKLGLLVYWRTTLSTSSYECSEEFRRIYGLEPQSTTITFEQMNEMILPADKERVLEDYQAAVEQQRPYALDYRIKRPDGTIRHLRVRARPEIDVDGTLIGYFGVTQDVTEQKTAEEALRERDYLFRRAEKMGQLGHYTHDYQARKTYWSDNMFAIHGLEDAGLPEFDPERGSRVADPEEAERFLGPRREAIKNHAPSYAYTTVINRASDGSRREIYGECSFEYNSDGTLRVMFGVVKDITAEREALHILRQREQELAEAQRIGQIGHFRWFSETDVAERSDQMRALLGLNASDDELTGQEFDARIFPDDRDDYAKAYEESLKSRSPFEIQYRYMRAEGDIRHFKQLAHPEFDAEGNVVSVFGVTQDITKQAEAETALRDRERWLSTVVSALDHSHFGLTMQDENGQIVYANNSVAEIGGFEGPKALMGRNWLELSASQTPEFKDIVLKARQEAFDRGYSTVDFDWTKVNNGEICRVEARSTPAPGGGLIILFFDITEQRAQEERHEMLEAGMREAQKMDALGQLAGGTAHEINNLLHPIITFARLTQDKTDDPQLREYQEDILECSRKAAKIVSDVLIFARRSTGERERVDAVELTKRAMRFAKDIAAPAIDLNSDFSDDTVLVAVNETEFIQIVLNLVKNASDAMDGKGTIDVGAKAVTLEEGKAQQLSLTSGDYLCLSVKDEGAGISPSTLARIFDPFFTTKEVGRGTGLGLSVVYGIVKDWNGSIHVESKLEHGSLFEVFVPIAKERQSHE